MQNGMFNFKNEIIVSLITISYILLCFSLFFHMPTFKKVKKDYKMDDSENSYNCSEDDADEVQEERDKDELLMNKHNHSENDASEVSDIKVCYIFITITEH
jgi:hypothetical protein